MGENAIKERTDTTLKNWREKEKKAVALLHYVGELRFDRSIEIVLFRRDIYDSRPSKVLNDHLFAENYVNKPINVETTLDLVKQIADIEEFPPAKIDVGKLAAEWIQEQESYDSMQDFVLDKLGYFLMEDGQEIEPKDVVLYGFGRIGRLIARRIIALTGRGGQLRLKAIVIRPKMSDLREEMEKRLALLRDDSIHGAFPGNIEIADDGSEVIINGNRIRIIFADQPTEIDYTEYGIENGMIIDNTGAWRNRQGLEQHMRTGISQVLLTAPGKDFSNIVYGVNQNEVKEQDDSLISAASCTTNAIVPIIKVLDDRFGIEKGHIETIHAYTSDQNLLDNFHKKPRRGRGAAINMVLTSTGAAKAVSKVLPHLDGKLTGNAVRVPTPDVSLAIMSLTLNDRTDREALNEVLKDASLHGDLVEQIHYSESTEYVSSNAIGMTSTSVLDAPSTKVSEDGKTATVYAWYDNEFGYCCQVVRLAKFVARVRRYHYY